MHSYRGTYEETKTQKYRSSHLRQTSARGGRRRIDGGESAVESHRANSDTNPIAFAAAVTNTWAHNEGHDAQRGETNRHRADRQTGRRGATRSQSRAG